MPTSPESSRADGTRSRVIFLCGPSGSGKTTLARRFEAEGMTRLSIDAEAWAQGFRSFPVPEEAIDGIDRAVRDRLQGLLAQGRDVVLDFSFSRRAVREEWRAMLAPWGIVPETVYLDTPREECLARMQRRRGEHGDDVMLDPELAARHIDDFEAPTPEEGPLTVL